MSVWSSVGVTLAIQMLVSMVVFTPPVIAPAAQTQIGVPASAVGVATALIYLTATLGALVSGRTIARHGPLRVSQLSLVLCGIGITVIATAHVLAVALGALIIGLGYGWVTPSSSAILADRAPRNLRAFIFSLKQTGVPVGGALAGALIPALVLTVGWQAATIAAGAVCLVLALALQPLRRSVDSGSRSADNTTSRGLLEPVRLVLLHRGLREMAFASFTYSGMQMCLGTFLVVFLHDRIGFGLSSAGAALSAAMAAGIAGRLAWGVAADRLGKPRLLLAVIGVTMSLAAFATAAITSAWPVFAVFVVSAIYGATAVGWNGVYLSEVARVAPAGRAAAATGASLAMTYAGVMVLPALFWAIVELSGSYAAAFAVTGCLTLWRSSLLFRGTSALHAA